MRAGRVLAAGIAAGVVINTGGMAAAAVLGLAESFGRAGVVPDLTGALLHLSLRFGVGCATSYLYVAAAGRFGFGWSTALRVGIAVWFIGYLPSLALLHEIGFLTSWQALAAVIWGLFEASLGASAAALVYGERGAKSGPGR